MRALRGARQRWRQFPRLLRWGWALGLLTVLTMIALLSGTLPVPGSADAYWHMDYVYQLWNGHLPLPYGPEWVMPGYSRVPESPEGVHYTAAHPPLLYVLALPVVGPLFATQNLILISLAARAVNVVIAVLLFAALARFAWHIGGRIREPLSVALPTVTMLLVPVTELAGEFYNDLLLSLAVVLGLTEAVLALQHGLTRRRVVMLALVAAMGMSSKATFLFTLVLLLLTPAIAMLVHRTGPWWKRLAGAVVPTAIIGLSPAVVIGWFYYRNWTFSGSPLTGVEGVILPGRTFRTASDVVHLRQFWLEFPSGWLGIGSWGGTWGLNYRLAIALFFVALAVSLAWWVRSRPSRVQVLVALGLLGQVVMLQAAQFYHALGYGALNWRYLMPGAFIVGLVLVLGVVGFGSRLAGVGAGFAILGLSFAGAYDRANYDRRHYAQDVDHAFESWRVIAGIAGYPVWPLWVVAGLAAVSGLATALIIGRLRAAAPSEADATQPDPELASA